MVVKGMEVKMIKIPAGVFKSKCLKLMDDVNKTREEIIITKFGKPVAKLVPVQKTDTRKEIFGIMKDMISIKEDIIKPAKEDWDAER